MGEIVSKVIRRIKYVIRNLSIKKAFMLYMLLFLLVAVLLSSISINMASDVKNHINLKYSDAQNKYTLDNGINMVVIAVPAADYSKRDKITVNICSFVEIWSIPIFFGLCIIMSALLFYHSKLEKPIELLNGASAKIAGNDLDFKLSYDSRDEMGQLCHSFEIMRAALNENNMKMWRAVEERKQLNAAFSHDLRTPLTVLRGYADLLSNYVPKGKISEEKLVSTVSVMSAHVARLESYVQMMSDVQKLEDIDVSVESTAVGFLMEQFKGSAEVLVEGTGLKLDFINEIPEQEILIDSTIVQRVYENLIANSTRYAKETIAVNCSCSDQRLAITVSDDGCGFSIEELQQVDKPYFRSKSNSGECHFGLGLAICRLLCKKHKGGLIVANGTNGGALVKAEFQCGMNIS